MGAQSGLEVFRQEGTLRTLAKTNTLQSADGKTYQLSALSSPKGETRTREDVSLFYDSWRDSRLKPWNFAYRFGYPVCLEVGP